MTLRTRIRRSLFPFVLGLAASCAPRLEPTAESSSTMAAARPAGVEEAIARHVAVRDDPVRSRAPIGGVVSISDDQMSNMHTVYANFFHGGAGPSSACIETIVAEEGLKCVVVLLCAPPGGVDGGAGPGSGGPVQPLPPGDPGSDGGLPPVVTVGRIEVAATFDTVRLEAGRYGYPFVTRPGPFWNGDGDQVTLSLEGEPGAISPFTHRMPAPVPDAVSRIPASADRDQPLLLEWRYADGKVTAPGYMTVNITQFGGSSGPTPPNGGPSPGVSIVCGIPAAKRAMHVPPAVLRRFQPGGAFVGMSSTIEERYVSEGSLALYVDLTARVDTGDPGGGPIGAGGMVMLR